MLIEPNRFARPLETRCDAEPIHLAGSIQPHGVLLVFNPADEKLIQWAGDGERFLESSLAAGVVAGELLGKSLGNLLDCTMLKPGCEPLHAGFLHLPGREPASLSVHATTHAVIVELEAASESISGADLLERVRRISEQLTAMATLQGACDAAAGEVGAISGFDRVMIYQFNEDLSGTVIAEAVANSADSYLGQRFPAGDIPSQARELYRRNLLRVIADVDYRPVGLEPPAAGEPLDMSNCILRSVSPIHLQYLKNMDVAASMSVSVIVEGRLWG